jgi:hypothetical protein
VNVRIAHGHASRGTVFVFIDNSDIPNEIIYAPWEPDRLEPEGMVPGGSERIDTRRMLRNAWRLATRHSYLAHSISNRPSENIAWNASRIPGDMHWNERGHAFVANRIDSVIFSGATETALEPLE